MRVDSAGIQLVTSSERDVPLDWTFERDRDLLASHEANLVFPQGIAVTRAGHIHVINGRHEVLVLDTLGNLVRRIGREGQGPGEFRGAAALTLDAGDTLYVADFPKRAFVRFTPSGDFLDEQPLHRGFRGGVLRRTPRGYVTTVIATDQDRQVQVERLIDITAADTSVLLEIERTIREGPRFDNCPGLTSAPAGPAIFTPWIR